ncbi:PmoA family protein [Nocardiopsis dassonvillei]
MNTLTLDGCVLAVLRDGTDIEPTLSPRPYLHPVRTLAGVPVTEERPADHLHHFGVGVAVPDVSGVSFWGGRTFTRDRGSVLLDNHGRQRHVSWLELAADRRVEALSWTGPDGAEMLSEERTVRAAGLDGRTWVLDVRTQLRNTSGRDLSIGSPATNGRPGAGYGGLFWRAPVAATPPAVVGAGGLEGEKALHGSRAEWLALVGGGGEGAVAAGAAAGEGAGGRGAQGGGAAAGGAEGGAADADEAVGGGWTLVFLQPGEHTDPWFLRAEDYPGVGPALAWDTRLPLPEGGRLERRLRVAVRDGRADGAGELATLAEAARDLF